MSTVDKSYSILPEIYINTGDLVRITDCLNKKLNGKIAIVLGHSSTSINLMDLLIFLDDDKEKTLRRFTYRLSLTLLEQQQED